MIVLSLIFLLLRILLPLVIEPTEEGGGAAAVTDANTPSAAKNIQLKKMQI